MKALQDDAVVNAIGKIFKVKLKEVKSEVSSLKAEVLYPFTNRKARDAVYRARKSLKDVKSTLKIFISEDFTKYTVEVLC